MEKYYDKLKVQTFPTNAKTQERKSIIFLLNGIFFYFKGGREKMRIFVPLCGKARDMAWYKIFYFIF